MLEWSTTGFELHFLCTSSRKRDTKDKNKYWPNIGKDKSTEQYSEIPNRDTLDVVLNNSLDCRALLRRSQENKLQELQMANWVFLQR